MKKRGIKTIGIVGAGAGLSLMEEEKNKSVREPIVIGLGKKGVGKSAMDAFEPEAQILILGASEDISVHVSIIKALSHIGTSIDEVHIVTPEEVAKSNLPANQKEHIKEGSQFLVLRDLDKFEERLPAYKIEKLTSTIPDRDYIKSKKELEKHPFDKFIGKGKKKRR